MVDDIGYISDLHTVNEDEEESDEDIRYMAADRLIKNKEECEEFVQEQVTEKVVLSFILKYIKSVEKVKGLLSMWVHKRHFRKVKASTAKI